jgi:hypothetical protein
MIRKLAEVGEDSMYTALESLGYDQGLYSFKSRSFVLTVHSRAQNNLSLTQRNMTKSSLGKQIVSMLLECAGEEKTSGPVKLLVYYEELAGGYTYGVHNSTG